MQLFVGLGNPGQQYKMNRHNIGFMAVDEYRMLAHLVLGGPSSKANFVKAGWEAEKL